MATKKGTFDSAVLGTSTLTATPTTDAYVAGALKDANKSKIAAYPAASAGVPMVNFRKKGYKMPTPFVKEARTEESAPSSAGPSSISLYIPGGMKESIGAEWGPEDVLRTFYTSKGWMSGAGADVIGAVVDNAKQGASTPVATAGAKTGSAQSPNSLFIFQKAKGFALQFNYEIMIIDPAEGKYLLEVANSFKASTLPSIGTLLEVACLKYPDIWDISFSGLNGIGNPVIGSGGKYRNMALVQCDVGYGEGVSVMTYKDGNPIKLSIGLTFQSIELAFQPGK